MTRHRYIVIRRPDVFEVWGILESRGLDERYAGHNVLLGTFTAAVDAFDFLRMKESAG